MGIIEKVTDRISERTRADVEAVLDSDQMPNDKRAAVTIIDLRTRVEVRTLALQISLALNVGLLTAVVGRMLLR